MYQVRKRNGTIVDFDLSRIRNALQKAFDATKTYVNDDIVDFLALKVTAKLAPHIKEGVVDVEKIQDVAESVLATSGYDQVAKAYILYREQHRQIRALSEEVRKFGTDLVSGVMGPVDVTEFHDPSDSLDIMKNQNASVGSGTLGAAILQESEAVTKMFWENKYTPEIREASQVDGGNGEMYIHDMGVAAGYCFTGNTRIKTLDGKHTTFKDLVDNGVKMLWVFAIDQNGEIKPALAENPRVTREVEDICNITLQSGDVITCTPDHPIMLRDGSFIEAKDLKRNQALMPLYVGDASQSKYCEIHDAWYSKEHGERHYLHRWIAEQMLGRSLKRGEVVHHINGDKHDNRPENLEVMDDAEHRLMPLAETRTTDTWIQANKARLEEYNKSSEKRAEVSLRAQNRDRDAHGRFAYIPGKDAAGVAYSHSVQKVDLVHLNKAIKVYDLDVPQYHNFALDVGVFVHNCAGWSLKDLILKGISGVPKKTSSAPASHLSTLCNQMVNYLGIMQNEWAGAQAFSSFDTYLAPFVKKDNLTYDQVKQCIQSFVFGINTPSRWGCVPADTTVLAASGWKRFDELQKGEMIYTWNNGRLELCPVNEVVVKEHHGILHEYKARGYNQTVTPEHRVLCKKHNLDKYEIKHSDEIFGAPAPYYLPAQFLASDLKDETGLSEAEVQMAAIIYCDGSIDMRNGRVHKVVIYQSPDRTGNEEIVELANDLSLKYSFSTIAGGFGSVVNKYSFYGDSARKIVSLVGNTKKAIDNKFLHLDSHLSEVFIRTWMRYDGNESRARMQYDNEQIADSLQHVALRAGYTSFLWYNESHNAHYIRIRQVNNVQPSERKEIPYDGIVWCPNVANGTAVFRSKDGEVFISGQCQAPFSNITLDWVIPEDLAPLPAIVSGKEQEFTYGDCQHEADMVNKAFIEVMVEGDADGRGFAYPIPTYSITRDFDWDPKDPIKQENLKLLFEMAAKYGTPYFSNYINSDMNPSDVRSMCCRLRLDLRELRKQNGGNFGAGENTGSVGVVTINLPHIAYISATEEDFFNEIVRVMDLAAQSLDIKRRVITAYLERPNSAYPYTKAYLSAGLKNHFSTIGIVGMNEACLNAKWLGKDLTDPKCIRWANKVLDFMREKLSDYQEVYGCLFNLEATPAESTCRTLAKIDKLQFPDIITAAEGNGTPYYTNSTHLPVNKIDDVFEALDLEDEMQTKYTSGTVFHAFLGERLPDWHAAMILVRKIAENYKLPYFTLSPTYSICSDHGYINGEQYQCPDCGHDTEVYSRITGYYRPVQNWNAGKLQEFKQRKEYNVGTSRLAHQGPIDLEKTLKLHEHCACGYEAHTAAEIQEQPAPAPAADSTPVEVQSEPHRDKTPMIFATRTCPNCKMICSYMDKIGYPYKKLLADENVELVKMYRVQQAPTMVIDNGTDAPIIKIGAGAIKQFIDQQIKH